MLWLTSPTEVRRALVYVLFNARKHARKHEAERGVVPDHWLDQCSSAAWFEAWHPEARPPPDIVTLRRKRDGDEPPTAKPETWLARAGWLRAGGPIRFNE